MTMRSQISPPVRRLHADRAAGGDRDHRRADRAAAARRAVGPRGRPPRPVREQPEADRPGVCTTTRAPTAPSPRRFRRTSPSIRPITQFADGTGARSSPASSRSSKAARLQRVNFNVDYNGLTGMNFTGARRSSTSSSALATRQPDGGNDGVDPNDPIVPVPAAGLRLRRLRPDRLHRHQPRSASPPGTPTPYRDKSSRQTACSSRARPRSARSPTAPATPSPSARTPAATPASSAPHQAS